MTYFNFTDRPSIERIDSIAKQFNLNIHADSVYLYLAFQKTYREIEDQYNNLLEKFDLSESRFAILMFLSYAKDKQLLSSEIAQKLNVARPTVSKLIKGMMNQELIITQKSKIDKRATYVKMTKKGEKTLQSFLPYNYLAIDCLFENFTEKEKDLLNSLLKKLSTNKQKMKSLEEKMNENSKN